MLDSRSKAIFLPPPDEDTDVSALKSWPKAKGKEAGMSLQVGYYYKGTTWPTVVQAAA